ncbi:MAG: hypothetical protein U9R51_04205 [Actinomycetota bacterium]|nr:hypothetical protein [Actinomycetota bacterium]
MKRFWIILLAAAMALVIALPAGAGKPCCGTEEECAPLEATPTHPSCVTEDPEPPPPAEDVVCAFSGSGVLLSEAGGGPIALGEGNISYRCKLTAGTSDSFDFEIGTTDGATTLLQPMVAVTDAYPSGDICFREFEVGRMTADAVSGVFVKFSMDGIPLDWNSDGECDFVDTNFTSDERTDIYTLTFQTGKTKGGTVQLTVTPAPMQQS